MEVPQQFLIHVRCSIASHPSCVAAPTMLADHFPYNVAHALDVAAESYGAAGRATGLYRDGCTLEVAKKFR